MNPLDKSIEITKIRTGKEVLEKEIVKANKAGKLNCYISRIER